MQSPCSGCKASFWRVSWTLCRRLSPPNSCSPLRNPVYPLCPPLPPPRSLPSRRPETDPQPSSPPPPLRTSQSILHAVTASTNRSHFSSGFGSGDWCYLFAYPWPWQHRFWPSPSPALALFHSNPRGTDSGSVDPPAALCGGWSISPPLLLPSPVFTPLVVHLWPVASWPAEDPRRWPQRDATAAVARLWGGGWGVESGVVTFIWWSSPVRPAGCLTFEAHLRDRCRAAADPAVTFVGTCCCCNWCYRLLRLMLPAVAAGVTGCCSWCYRLLQLVLPAAAAASVTVATGCCCCCCGHCGRVAAAEYSFW